MTASKPRRRDDCFEYLTLISLKRLEKELSSSIGCLIDLIVCGLELLVTLFFSSSHDFVIINILDNKGNKTQKEIIFYYIIAMVNFIKLHIYGSILWLPY